VKKEKEKTIINAEIKGKANNIIKKSKEMNLIKPLSSAFETALCEREVHRGKKEYFCKY